MIFDKDFLTPLMFFLQESTPFYICLEKVVTNNSLIKLYDRIRRNALTIVCRLITNRESDNEFISKEKQAEILYKNFIINIPMLFDCLTLYGPSNKTLIQKIIETLVKIEPKYLNDLKIGIKFIQSTFDSMKKQLDTIESTNRNLFEQYEDITMYLMNVSATLGIIVDLSPNDVKACCSRDLHLEQTIASFYDNFIPLLYQYSFSTDSEAWFLIYIKYARVELLNCYRSLLNRGVSAILNAGEKNRQKLADNVLSTLTATAGYKNFIMDYVRLWPVELDIDVVAQSGKNMLVKTSLAEMFLLNM